MRYIFLLFAFLIFSDASAQDFCKQVIKEVSPDKKILDYASPNDPDEVTYIKVTRTINVDPDYESDNFLIVLQTLGELDNIYTKDEKGEQVEKDEWKLVITFDDNSTIVDETLKVSHDFTSDKLQAIRSAYFPVTDAAAAQLSTKKIAKYSLAGYEKTVSPEYANAVMHYVDCIKKAK